MGRREFELHYRVLHQAAKTVNKFESEQVQLRVIDSLLATLKEPDEVLEDEGPGNAPNILPALRQPTS
jgi:hypothetical protein